MDNIQTIKVKPQFVAQICPNCNGRGTVGFDKHPCPTCGNSQYKGVILIPVDGRMEERTKDYER